MKKGLFQTPLREGHPVLNGTIEAEVYELGGTAPKRVIRSDQDWEVRVEWKLCGELVRCLNPNDRWHLHVNIESMGPGPEKTYFVGEKRVRDHTVTPEDCFEWSLTKRFTETELEPIRHEGELYKVFTTLTYRLESGRPGPFAGFVELLPVQIFKVIEDEP